MWVLTKEVNDYNQHGEHFLAVWRNKPDFHALKKVLPHCSDVTVGKLTRGGGEKNEDEWYYLFEVKEGVMCGYTD